jgi:hypothetical protein
MPWWHYNTVDEIIKDLERLANEDWRIRKKERFKTLAEKTLEFHRLFTELYKPRMLGYALLYRPAVEPVDTILEEKVYAIVGSGLYNINIEIIDIEEWLEKRKPAK